MLVLCITYIDNCFLFVRSEVSTIHYIIRFIFRHRYQYYCQQQQHWHRHSISGWRRHLRESRRWRRRWRHCRAPSWPWPGALCGRTRWRRWHVESWIGGHRRRSLFNSHCDHGYGRWRPRASVSGAACDPVSLPASATATPAALVELEQQWQWGRQWKRNNQSQ